MAEALNCGNRSDFWKKVRAAGPKKSHSLASSIDIISGTAAIAEMWKNKFSNLTVAYNDAYRILHGMPCYHSARESQIYYNIDSFYALQRKITYKFVERCHLSQNLWLKMLMSSDCFYDSVYYDHYCGILFVNE